MKKDTISRGEWKAHRAHVVGRGANLSGSLSLQGDGFAVLFM